MYQAFRDSPLTDLWVNALIINPHWIGQTNITDIYSGGQTMGHIVLLALPDACEGDK
ncbi:hypothetical protein [Ewingella americana]|uniref:Uncharacterized protein n=2 Tax=Ewingella americana TaxID=41202 RepID=A0A085GA91_EWIA3|nr:hypothetical protein [Ewingella americana]KFC80636.1 hypothetical protein GEAM_1955 [Ewingella americana ATCC 33852]STQ44332.1 Uncharacterised protein [Ewingella americana]